MTGSKKWFSYTADDGTVWALKGDESNIEGVHGSTGAGAPPGTVYKPPSNLKVRYAVYGNAAGTRSIRVPVLTPTIYTSLAPGDTIPDITGTGTLSYIRRRPERITDSPTVFDTGQTDGDQP